MVKPETVVSWHRAGFRRYWTVGGKPSTLVIGEPRPPGG
jgi:hypothetical protein